MENLADIDLAIKAHTLWMSQVRQAVLDALSGIDVHSIRADSHCDFGKWLFGPGLSADDRLTEHYREVRRLHAEFHELSGRIVELAAAGQVAEAYTLLYGEYITLSGKLVLALRAWQASVLGF